MTLTLPIHANIFVKKVMSHLPGRDTLWENKNKTVCEVLLICTFTLKRSIQLVYTNGNHALKRALNPTTFKDYFQ